jgi:hypothetical protein
MPAVHADGIGRTETRFCDATSLHQMRELSDQPDANGCAPHLRLCIPALTNDRHQRRRRAAAHLLVQTLAVEVMRHAE